MDEDVVADGEAIVREGEAGDAFYVIAAGKVKVYEARAAPPSTAFARTRLLREDAANMPTLQKRIIEIVVSTAGPRKTTASSRRSKRAATSATAR